MYTGVNEDEPTKYVADKNLSENVKKILEEVGAERKTYMGRVLTGDMFVSSKEKREELSKTSMDFAVKWKEQLLYKFHR